jgi:hypothetical protein
VRQAGVQWSLYWASKRTGTLFPPVVGRFINGRGEFYGDDTYNGKDIRARFIWSADLDYQLDHGIHAVSGVTGCPSPYPSLVHQTKPDEFLDAVRPFLRRIPQHHPACR